MSHAVAASCLVSLLRFMYLYIPQYPRRDSSVYLLTRIHVEREKEREAMVEKKHITPFLVMTAIRSVTNNLLCHSVSSSFSFG